MVVRTRGLLGRSAGLVALAGALISAAPAFGQGDTDQTTPADQTPSADTLQEVVVTAERRAENVQTTPISVVAISGSDLQAASVASVNDLQAVAPDLEVQSGEGNTMLNIRGIGITPVGADEVGGVIVVRDGIANTTAGYGLDMPFYDMADVEVLRGPQGTFAGDNSTGGAIDINSQNPNFRGINGYITAKVATYTDQGLQGAVNLPVSDTLAMRFAFNGEQRGSFFRDEGSALDGPFEAGPLFTPGGPGCPSNTEAPTAPCASHGVTNKTGIDPGNLNEKDGRFGLLWRPTDNFQSLTKIEIDNNDTDGLPNQPNINTYAPLAGQPCPPGAETASPNACVSLYTFPGYSGSPYVLNNWDSALKWTDHISMYSEELRYTLSSGTVARFIAGDTEIGNTTLSNGTNDAIDNQGGQTSTATNQGHAYNAEFDLISPSTGPFQWIAGAAWTYTANQFGLYSINTAFPFSAPGAPGLGPQYIFWTNGETIYAKSEGVFGQITWQINPQLQFLIGARVGWDRDTGMGDLEILFPTDFIPGFPNVPLTGGGTGQEFPLQAIGASYGGVQLEAADNAVPTGKIGLNWTPVPGQFFYVFWARGYKPGLQNLGTAPATTKEFVNDSEFGWKGTFANGHLLTQFGGYYMNYYQMIESIFNPYNVQGTSDANIPYSSIRGLEAGLQTQVGGFSFDISADYNKSVLGPIVTAATYAFPATFGNTPQCPPGVTPNADNTNCTNYLPYMRNLSGEQLPFSPLFQGNATLKYAMHLGSNSTVTPRLQYSYISKSYASLFDIHYYELPAHGLLNAYLDWSVGPWTTELFATNVADKLYLINIGSDEDYGNPRQYGLQLTRTF